MGQGRSLDDCSRCAHPDADPEPDPVPKMARRQISASLVFTPPGRGRSVSRGRITWLLDVLTCRLVPVSALPAGCDFAGRGTTGLHVLYDVIAELGALHL